MAPDVGGESRIDRAIRRLDRAATSLEQRIARRIAQAAAQGGTMVDVDRARLAAELDAARGRERELEAAGAEASAALAEAAAQLKVAIADRAAGKKD